MSEKKLSKAALRRAIRSMAADLADTIVDWVEEQGLWDEPDPESEEEPAPPRVRRSPADLERWMQRIVGELRKIDEPVAIGTVAARLGTSSRKISHPMALLVEQGRVTRKGERRGARYQLPARKKKRPRAATRRSPEKKTG